MGIKLFIDSLEGGRPVKREVELPTYWLGFVIEVDNHTFRIIEGECEGEGAAIELQTPTGRFVIHPGVSNSFTLEARKL